MCLCCRNTVCLCCRDTMCLCCRDTACLTMCHCCPCGCAESRAKRRMPACPPPTLHHALRHGRPLSPLPPPLPLPHCVTASARRHRKLFLDRPASRQPGPRPFSRASGPRENCFSTGLRHGALAGPPENCFSSGLELLWCGVVWCGVVWCGVVVSRAKTKSRASRGKHGISKKYNN